jgi:hypothetical protein
MRQLFFLMWIPALISFQVSAQPATGTLRVRFDDYAQLTVAVNGRHFPRTGRTLTIGDLPSGRHHAKVYWYRAYKEGGGNAKLIYADRIRIRPGTTTYCIIEKNTGRAQVYTREGVSAYDPDFDETAAAAPAAQESDAGGGGMATASARADISSSSIPPLAAEEMKALEKRVSNHVADEEKLALLQQELGSRVLSTVQVKEMLFWLGAETNRLEFAKWAYSRTRDRELYDQVAAALVYERSKEELRSYISGQQ